MIELISNHSNISNKQINENPKAQASTCLQRVFLYIQQSLKRAKVVQTVVDLFVDNREFILWIAHSTSK